MFRISALWATVVLVHSSMQAPVPDSGYTGVDCSMVKKDKYWGLSANIIQTPPHMVSGSTCTSYAGTRIYISPDTRRIVPS